MIMKNSISKEYYSMDDFYDIDKIDAHFHLNSDSTVLAELAKEDRFKLLAVKTDVPFFPSLNKQHELIESQREQFPNMIGSLTTFSLVNWESDNWADQTIATLKSDFAKGALGVKVWKNIGMAHKNSANQFVMIDDPKFDMVIEYILQQNKTVLGHLGEPRNCWLPIEKMTVKNDKEYFEMHPEYHMFLHPEYPSYEDQINARDSFLQKHPDLQFVGAHLGSLEWSIDELAKRLDKFPNMAVDMADRVCHLQYQSKTDRDKVRSFIFKYQDRLLYATDFIVESDMDNVNAKNLWHQTWFNDWKYFVTNENMTAEKVEGEFKGLQLPKEIVDKIFLHNAVRYYKMN
jgi:hypothetical protein